MQLRRSYIALLMQNLHAPQSLPIFYTQRDNLFYAAWAFALPTTLLRIPYSLLESFLWSIIVYWSVGLAPTAGRFFTFWLLLFLAHQVG